VSPAAFDADIIIVGSGPAGVSAAFPLVESGARVMMIDGASSEKPAAEDGNERWRRMLGSELEALLPEDGVSPKLRTPHARRIVRDFERSGNIRGEGFIAIGARSRGGLSQIWGALACQFGAEDVEGWPLPIEELRPSYKIVAERMGVSGSATDEMASFYGQDGAILPPLPLGPSAAKLLSRYERGSQGSQFALGLARNAILSVDRSDRKSCDLRNDCLWGCTRGAIYDARYDLAGLQEHREFRLVDNAFATRLSRAAGGWTISTQDGREFSAPRLVLAAGTLGTIALVLPLLSDAPSELALLSSAVAAMPILLPARLGSSPDAKTHSLAQLGYRLRYGSAAADYVTGAMYEVGNLPASSFVARFPFSRPTGTDFFAFLAPALLISTIYFPGALSSNKVRCESRDGQPQIRVCGGFNVDLQPTMKSTIKQLRRIWKRLGAWPLPGTSLGAPGTDVHYAGPFGMGQQAAYGTTRFGELHGAPGVYVVDGAAFPTLPSKYLTLTIMANADRVGRHLALTKSVGRS
jgi:choline dehydrogenase-like flavoprotein